MTTRGSRVLPPPALRAPNPEHAVAPPPRRRVLGDPHSRRAAEETVRQRSYTRDDGIDREALARWNAAILMENGVPTARVAAEFPQLRLCPWCGSPRKRNQKTCCRPECVRAAKSRPKSAAHRARIGAGGRRAWAEGRHRMRGPHPPDCSHCEKLRGRKLSALHRAAIAAGVRKWRRRLKVVPKGVVL